MSLFNDPGLRLQPADLTKRKARTRVRLLPGSAFARDMRVPAGATGEVRGGYEQDGEQRLSVWVPGTGMLFGVPRAEVEQVDR